VDCLSFRAKSAYGQFRKPYTTTSALTFLCIHPIAIKGLVGAIIGLDRSELYEKTKDMCVGVRVVNQVRKDLQSVKLHSHKKPKGSREELIFPANVEFLREVEYEIFVMWNTEKLNELEVRLKERNPVYTPCLGVTEHVAKVDFIGRYDINKVDEACEISSVVPVSAFNNVMFGTYDVCVDTIPIENNNKREYTKYEKVIFAFCNDVSCSLICKADGVFGVGGRNIFFF
jgi:CRISPR-associated protein Cas5h